jgi:hypothetical protein
VQHGGVKQPPGRVFRTVRAMPREPHEGVRRGLDELRGRGADRPLRLLECVARVSVGEAQGRAEVRIS